MPDAFTGKRGRVSTADQPKYRSIPAHGAQSWVEVGWGL